MRFHYKDLAETYPVSRYESTLVLVFRTEKVEIIARFNDKQKSFPLRTQDLSSFCVSTHRIEMIFCSKFLQNSAKLPFDFQHASA